MVVQRGLLRRSLKALCLGSVAFAAAGAAHAADAAKDGTLEELVVTARFATENVQAVPITDNVLSAEGLDKRNIQRLADLSELVPNFQWDNSGGSSVNSNLKMTMRGIASSASQNGFEPGIGIYVDDVYIGDAIGFNNSLLDVERIEVLKGPQGTRFGRNTVAGAISVHTRRPSFKERYSEVEVGFGNYAMHEFKGLTNLPLSDTTALKLSAIYRKRDGYLFNTVTQKQDLNDEDHYGGRAQLLWSPAEKLDLLFSADYFHDKGDSEGQVCYGVGPAPGNFASCATNLPTVTILGTTVNTVNHPTQASIRDDQAADNYSKTKRSMWSTSLNTGWQATEQLHVTSITAYGHLKGSNDQDQDYTPLNLLRSGYNVPKDWQFSEELRVSTEQSKRIRGTGGLFYFHEDRDVILPQYYTSLVLQLIGLPAGTPDQTTTTRSSEIGDSIGAFGQGTFDITDTLSVDGGLRYTKDHKKFGYQELVDPLLLKPPAQAALGIPAAVPLTRDSHSWGKLTGNASVDWKPIQDTLVYLTYSTGFKSGGYNNQLTSTTQTLATKPFGPEEMSQWETGAKTEFFQHRLRINVAAFYMDYSSIQTSITEPGTSLKYVINAGGAKSKGMEFEIAATPLSQLTLEANAGFQHSHYTSFPAGGTTNLIGKDLFYAPHSNATLSATWDQPFGRGWNGQANVTAAYRSNMWLDAANTTLSKGLTTVRGRLTLTAPDKRYSVAIWGNNLTDVRRITATTTRKFSQDGGAARLTDPKTYGVELKANF